MSESSHKKVIHVRDLVIKADNVYIEPETRPRRHSVRDTFGGRRAMGERDDSPESSEGSESWESQERVDHDDERSDDKRDDRRPFSWI